MRIRRTSSRLINRLAVEIKGGTDKSNIHNRLGEAEKSHGKAKDKGFTEFWTIINVEVPLAQAQAGSRTTNAFFHLAKITDPLDPEWIRFREAVASRLGVRAAT